MITCFKRCVIHLLLRPALRVEGRLTGYRGGARPRRGQGDRDVNREREMTGKGGVLLAGPG
jgi:hypothetical protein